MWNTHSLATSPEAGMGCHIDGEQWSAEMCVAQSAFIRISILRVGDPKRAKGNIENGEI